MADLEDTVDLADVGPTRPMEPGPTDIESTFDLGRTAATDVDRDDAENSQRMLLGGTGALPATDQRLEAACGRLHFALLAALAALILGLVALPLVAANVGGVRDGIARPFWTMPAGLVITVAMLFVVRRKSLAPARRLTLGLVYLVAASALTGAFTHWLPYDNQLDVVRGPSGVALLVLVFAALVPVPPKQLAIGACVAALMDPLSLVASFGVGNPVPRPTLWVWLFLPTVGATAVAIAISHTLYDLGRQLEEARRMGGYRLTKRLGVGGMGEVWRAEHQTLARPAAVKLIRPERLGSDHADADRARKRFAREAQATAMLESPHTIEVYDFGVADDGSFYYVMELLDGEDLSVQVERDGPLPPERVVHLLLQACHSLGEAHERGLVHRDIKPANLYVCRRAGEHDVLKVLDFGIVKLADEVDANITQEGSISGTPAFIAPETIQGADVDGRADLYALGCVAFYLLTGEVVFGGRNAMAMVMAHVQDAPMAPSQHRPVPEALDALVLELLEKDRGKRPPDCAALADRLRALDLGPWTSDQAAEAWRSRSAPGQGATDAATTEA